MKHLSITILTIALFLGCKKKEIEIPKTGETYYVQVNLDDGLGYSMKIDGGPYNFVNVIPPSKNASGRTNVFVKYEESKTILAELGFSGRGKMIEIIVTNSETGELIFSDKKVDKVTATWTAKK